MMAAEDRDELAARMEPLARQLTQAVAAFHADRVADLLVPLTHAELRGLAVVLADLCGPVGGNTPEQAIESAVRDALAADAEHANATDPDPESLAGRREAAIRIVAAGYGPRQIAHRLGVSKTAANTLYEYARRHGALAARRNAA